MSGNTACQPVRSPPRLLPTSAKQCTCTCATHSVHSEASFSDSSTVSTVILASESERYSGAHHADRAAALATALHAAQTERDTAEAAARTHLSSLAAVVREKSAVEDRLQAEQARASAAVKAAKHIAGAGDRALATLRAEVGAGVAKYEAEHRALAAEHVALKAENARLKASLPSRFRRRKNALAAEEGRVLELEAELDVARKERDAARAHARGAGEREVLRALEAVGEVGRAVRVRLGDAAGLEAVAAAEDEVRRRYERGVGRA